MNPLTKKSFGITASFIGYLFFMFGYVVIKAISPFIPTHQISLFRFCITPIILMPLFFMQKITFTCKQPKLLLFRSIIGCLAFYLYYLSLRYGNLGKMTLLYNFSVVWAFLFSHFFLKEKASRMQYLAIPLALSSAALILQPEGAFYLGKGEIFAILSAICTGIVAVSLKKLRQDNNTLSMIFIFFTFSSLILLPSTITNFVMPTFPLLMALLLIGLFGFLAHFFMTVSYKYIPANVGSSISLISIPLSYVFGLYFFAEKLNLSAIIGIGLFIVALYLIISKAPA